MHVKCLKSGKRIFVLRQLVFAEIFLREFFSAGIDFCDLAKNLRKR